MFARKVVAVAVLSLPCLAYSAPIDSTSYFSGVVTRLADDDRAISTYLRHRYGDTLGDEQAQVAKSHIQALLREPLFAQRLAALSGGAPQPGVVEEAYRQFVPSMLDAYLKSGLSRLSDKQLTTYFRFLRELIAELQPEQCASFLSPRDDPTQSGRIEGGYFSTKPLSEFVEVLDVTSAAIRAEVQDFPAVRIPTPEQESAALAMLSAVAEKLMTRQTSELGLSQGAPACRLLLTVYDSALAMPAPHRGWSLVRFVSALKLLAQ